MEREARRQAQLPDPAGLDAVSDDVCPVRWSLHRCDQPAGHPDQDRHTCEDHAVIERADDGEWWWYTPGYTLPVWVWPVKAA